MDLYGKATQNIRVVSREVSSFIEFLHNETGIEYSRIHMIGHSLGAHISGNAAAEIPGIARVTGKEIIFFFVAIEKIGTHRAGRHHQSAREGQ